jgi:hypothetical protein
MPFVGLHAMHSVQPLQAACLTQRSSAGVIPTAGSAACLVVVAVRLKQYFVWYGAV